MRKIAIITGLLCLLFACDDEKTQPIRMVSVGKIGQNDHLRPEQKDHPLAGTN